MRKKRFATMIGTLALCGLAWLLPVPPAMAGTVYRCDTSDGTRSYVSKRISGARCSAVNTQGPAVRGPAPSVPAAASANMPGDADPAAPVTFLSSAAPVSPAKPGAASTRRVQGQVYSYIKDGVRHYTSSRPKGQANAGAVRTIQYSFLETCFACGAAPGVNFGNVRLNRDAYRDEIATAARLHGVDEAVIRAIIHAESAFNPNALSRVGAQGLMQLMPATARRFNVGNPFDAGQNIQGGVEYLAWLLKRFNGNLTLAAAGYNAGEGAVDKYKGVPPYGETQRYVERVGVLAERYRVTQ